MACAVALNESDYGDENNNTKPQPALEPTQEAIGGFLVPQISRQRYCFDDGLATSVPVDKQYSNKHMFVEPGPNY